jgi:hypothetical protein
MDPIEHIFVDGHLVGHIAQDIGFEAFNSQGCFVGSFPTKERARRALEREPQLCEHVDASARHLLRGDAGRRGPDLDRAGGAGVSEPPPDRRTEVPVEDRSARADDGALRRSQRS